MERRLATIVSIDVVGYSRLMGEDEAGANSKDGSIWNPDGTPQQIGVAVTDLTY